MTRKGILENLFLPLAVCRLLGFFGPQKQTGKQTNKQKLVNPLMDFLTCLMKSNFPKLYLVAKDEMCLDAGGALIDITLQSHVINQT